MGQYSLMRFDAAKSAAWICAGVVVLVAVLPTGSILPLPSSALDRTFRYAVLSCLLVLGYPTKPLTTVAIATMLAFGLEIVQLVLPWRLASPGHVVSKLIGSALGIALGYLGVMLAWRIRRSN